MEKKKEKLIIKVDNENEKEIIINKKRLFEIIQETIFIILGAYIISLGINMFLLPHKMTTGGASGIGTILYYLFKVPIGYTVMLVNIPLLIISIKKIGLKFSAKTICSISLLSFFLEAFKYTDFIAEHPTDMFTSCVFGGLLCGIGLSLTFKTGASSGGSDLLAQIIYKSTTIQSLTQVLLTIEIGIIMSLVIVFKDINLGLYSIVAIFISSKVIDILFGGSYYTKVVNIITKNPDKLTDAILKDLKRGATITQSIGAHSKEVNTTITCIITRPQVAKLKAIVKKEDPNALMYITTSNEVVGEGFNNL